MPRRVPIPPVDAGRIGLGERLERHLSLLSRPHGPEVAVSVESATMIQDLLPRERAAHRLSRVTLMAPLRNRRRKIAL